MGGLWEPQNPQISNGVSRQPSYWPWYDTFYLFSATELPARSLLPRTALDA